ncbi:MULTISPECIES: IclR family transcriptional regulator [unclassified Caulobacter]|uniref:IclR family transcriptional regulator n=1 Tax=unclassified Caulobacter TaxID=2648921 RepID=UPI0006F6503D|nr:transcriptional regulator [Caulobacter sp. Root342]KQV67363.1 transcriptional regulator [Caulobacter sp. Root343]
MKPASRGAEPVAADENATTKSPSGSQTLFRGLDLLDMVAESGTIALPALAKQLGLTRSTTHRLATALVERRLLSQAPREGYSLGSKLLELGYLASQQMDLPRIARPHLERLWEDTEDTVHLGVLDDDRALYLDKLTGRRRINISSRVGDRQPIRSTGLGKALVLDDTEDRWRTLYRSEGPPAPGAPDEKQWIDWMRDYSKQGVAFDLEENEDRIRCVAAPIRGAAGQVVGAISVSGAAQYMDDERMQSLVNDVRDTANAIGRDLGWNGKRTAVGKS